MKPEISGYLKEIEDVGWVQEIIMERFDNALEFMTPHSIIYGGAVRDCIANKELVGDLDFAVPQDDFHKISEAFQTNPKWIPFNSSAMEIFSINSDDEDEVAQPVAKAPVLKIKNSGDMAKKFAPMSSISSFVTMGGKVVQLITSKYQDRDPLQSAIYVARMVDIVCCGMIMLCDGRIFEAVPGAYQDCMEGVLRINKSSDTIYLDALGARVEKLVSRGWKNTINVNKVIKEIEDSRERAKKKELRLRELRNKKSGIPRSEELKEYNFMHGGPKESLFSGGYMQEISKHQIETFFSGNINECLSLLELFASKSGINLRVKQTPIGNIYYETANSGQAHDIERKLRQYYEKKSLGNKPKRFEPTFKKLEAKLENPFSNATMAIPVDTSTHGSAGNLSSSWGTTTGTTMYTISTTSSSAYRY